MIMDKENLFSDDQAITVTADSTNVINLGVDNIGKGEPIEILCQVTEAFAAAGAATLQAQLETDDNAAMSSSTVVWDSGAIGKASLVVGYEFTITFVPKAGMEQYAGLVFTVATGPMTAGKITAGLIKDRQNND